MGEELERRSEQTSLHCIACLPPSSSTPSVLQRASHLAALICALSRDSSGETVLLEKAIKGREAKKRVRMSCFIFHIVKLTVALRMTTGLLIVSGIDRRLVKQSCQDTRDKMIAGGWRDSQVSHLINSGLEVAGV